MSESIKYVALLAPIHHFLHCETPDAWIAIAKQPENLPLLLTDHLICELKAAQTAMWLIRRYAADKASGDALLLWLKPYEDFVYHGEGDLTSLAQKNRLSKTIIPSSNCAYGQELVDKMVLLIKEELHHFFQVLEFMSMRHIPYQPLGASRYAKGLMKAVRTHVPATLIDKLICGAYIEARSCERFARLAPYLDSELEHFYYSLLRSEARHYQDYLSLAQQVADYPLDERIRYFGEIEAQLIQSSDTQLRFHSGVPSS